MRKRLINHTSCTPSPPEQDWFDLQYLALVELTSEDPDHPIESALLPGGQTSWRAAQPGAQTIRLLFDEPQRIRRIYLVFTEDEQARSQEFVLRWSQGEGNPYQELVRQQYNFSPARSTKEVEEYSVDLNGVRIIELKIIPDISGGEAKASLKAWHLA